MNFVAVFAFYHFHFQLQYQFKLKMKVEFSTESFLSMHAFIHACVILLHFNVSYFQSSKIYILSQFDHLSLPL